MAFDASQTYITPYNLYCQFVFLRKIFTLTISDTILYNIKCNHEQKVQAKFNFFFEIF